MSKIFPQDIKDLQFCAEQFGSQIDFDAFLQGIIDIQENLLSGLIGTDTFNSETAVVADRVKLAATNLVAIELFRRRINRLSGNADESTAAIIKILQSAKKEYQDENASLINRLASAPEASLVEDDFAGGVAVSDHFTVVT